MPSGPTYTNNLGDSLPTMIQSARGIREFLTRMVKLVDRQVLPEGQGTTWNEVSLSQLTAQDVAETDLLSNPQTYVDTLFSLVPVLSGISTLVTRRAKARIDKSVAAKMGSQMQEAIQRKKDKDGLVILDASSTSFGGAGTTLTSGHIDSAVTEVMNGTTNEPSTSQISTVLHSRQIKDLKSELTAGIGTYTIPKGITEETYRQGFNGTISGSNVFNDDNISIDANDDAKGGVFAKEGIVLVEGFAPYTLTKDHPDLGGGATEVFMYDEYVFGERLAGNSGGWVIEIFSDAAQPTS